jgi:hypothetical protein
MDLPSLENYPPLEIANTRMPIRGPYTCVEADADAPRRVFATKKEYKAFVAFLHKVKHNELKKLPNDEKLAEHGMRYVSKRPYVIWYPRHSPCAALLGDVAAPAPDPVAPDPIDAEDSDVDVDVDPETFPTSSAQCDGDAAEESGSSSGADPDADCDSDSDSDAVAAAVTHLVSLLGKRRPAITTKLLERLRLLTGGGGDPVDGDRDSDLPDFVWDSPSCSDASLDASDATSTSSSSAASSDASDVEISPPPRKMPVQYTTVDYTAEPPPLTDARYRKYRNGFIKRILDQKTKFAPRDAKLAYYRIQTRADGSIITPADYMGGNRKVLVVAPAENHVAHTAQTVTAHPPPQTTQVTDNRDPNAPVTVAMIAAHFKKRVDDGLLELGSYNSKYNPTNIRAALARMGLDKDFLKDTPNFDVAAWINSSIVDAIRTLAAAPFALSTIKQTLDIVRVSAMNVPALKDRVTPEAIQALRGSAQEHRDMASEQGIQKRNTTPVYSWLALVEWMKQREGPTGVHYQYLRMFEHVPLRGEIDGMKRAANEADAMALPKHNAWYVSNGTIVVSFRKYKTKASYSDRKYVIPADVARLILARVGNGDVLFKKGMVKEVGDVFRNNGVAFPYGPGQAKKEDLRGMRHTFAAFRNSKELNPEPGLMRGPPLAQLMLHSNDISETVYRNRTFLDVPGFNPDGTQATQARAGGSGAGAGTKRTRK